MKRILLLLPLLLFFLLSIAQTLTSSNLPVIVINTNGQTIQNEPKITADMGIIFNANNARNNITDPFNHYNGKIGIEVRGQSSQMFPMKSYSIELWDATGNSQDKALFGLPKESDWVLYAPYTDKTLMRNFLAYTLSNEMGHWAAHCRFVEVIINNDYKGIYVFMEKIKRGSGRVNIPKINTTDISGDALTGGYIFSLDKEPDGWYSSFPVPNSTTPSKRRFSYVYPKLENIVQQQKDYIKKYVDSFEYALASPDFQDPVNGVRKFADIPSFVDYFIVNEVSHNVDGYRLSSYFYKDRNSKNNKIVAGPVWDYDLSFRNANYCDGSNTNSWAYNFNSVCPGDGAGLIPFWWYQFENDTAFQGSLRCRWKQLRQTSLNISHLNFLIDSIVSLTTEARQRHFQRWPILGQYIWPNPEPIPTNYNGEISTLKQWLLNRLFWIDNNISNKGACGDYPADVKESVIISFYPNPFSSDKNLVIQSRIAQQLSLQVSDAMGRQLFTGQFPLTPVFNKINLNTDRWPPGVYFFQFSNSSGEKFTRKVMKQ
ncbi:MAG: CotH kinase family protein [Bacteroidota bacterium]